MGIEAKAQGHLSKGMLSVWILLERGKGRLPGGWIFSSDAKYVC